MAKQKHFYSHIVEIDSFSLELDNLVLSEKEKTHLIQLVESTMHHAIVDTVLSELKEEDKRTLLTHMHLGEHDKIWQFLNKKIDNLEEKIKTTAELLKKELHKDIREMKEKKTSSINRG